MFKKKLAQLVLVGAAVVFSSPAIAWQNYLNVRIIGNNNLFKAGEGERFEATLGDFSARLGVKGGRVCDPRTIEPLYPSVGKKRPPNCRKTNSPAPTNRQFETKWNPLTQKFDPGYLVGEGWDIRHVRIALFRKEAGGWTQKQGYACRWTIDDVRDDRLQPCRLYQRRIALGDHTAFTEVYKDGKPQFTSDTYTFTLKDFLIVAVGDSFGSGEGNPHTNIVYQKNVDSFKQYHAKPAQWLDARCHRSLLSSSGQTAEHLAESNRDTSFSLVNLACSGAESSFGLMQNYKGASTAKQNAHMWTIYAPGKEPRVRAEGYFGIKSDFLNRRPKSSKNNPAKMDILPQIDQLSEALGCSNNTPCRRPDAILVYLGVNDIGFSKRVVELVKGCKEGNQCETVAKEAIDRGILKIKENLAKFNAEIISRGLQPDESEQVYLVGYPNPLTRFGSTPEKSLYCDDKKVFGDGENQRLVKLSKVFRLGISEAGARWAEKNILDRLNETLEEAKEAHGWSFIQTKNSLLGRGYCSTKRSFNTYDDSLAKQGKVPLDYAVDTTNCDPELPNANCKGTKIGRFPSGTLHPNFFGHHLISTKINERLANDLGIKSR